MKCCLAGESACKTTSGERVEDALRFAAIPPEGDFEDETAAFFDAAQSSLK